MPECTQLGRTSAYFDGALAEAAEAAAVAHLAGCAECQALLRDAVTFDAVISQGPARARRWWPVAAIGAAAAAVVAVWLALPGAKPPAEVAIALPATRALEARFTGDRFAPHRPYDPLRGDRAHEAIALGALAELERRGDQRDLVAALASTGDVARARELAVRLPDDATGDSDRAALALAADHSEEALGHAYHALGRDHGLIPAWWNLALAARAQGLGHVAARAFDVVAAAHEPGWSDEAARQRRALEPELARLGPAFAAFDARGRAMVAGEAAITVDDAKRYPTWARIYTYEAIRQRGALAALRPVAAELDRAAGVPAMVALIDRAAAADPAVRAKLAADYRAALDDPAQVDAVLARLRAARGVDDLRVGLIIASGRAPERITELAALTAPWHDPWFDLAVERDRLRGQFQPTDPRAEPALAAAYARCTGWALRCGQLANDLADRFVLAGRDSDAERWARLAVERYLAAGSPVHLYTARATLADIHRNLTRPGLARAELDEIIQGAAPTDCNTRRFAQISQASLALFAGDFDAARAALPSPEPGAGCAVRPEFLAIGTAVDLARHSGTPADLARARAWLAQGNELAGGGIMAIGPLRLARGHDPAAETAARAWITGHTGDRTLLVPNLRAWGVTTLIADAGARGDWAGVLATALAEHGAGTAPCTMVATFDDDNVIVAARTAAGDTGVRTAMTAGQLGGQIVPPAITRALAGCPAIAVLARPPLHGRSDLLPAELPWAFAGDVPAHAPADGPPRRVDVSDAHPPDPALPRLAPAAPDAPFDQSITGDDATPSRVLAALADATYAELHVHGVAAAADDDATYLALSPDRDGSYALRADAVRTARLARGPVIVLAACRASTVVPYLHQRFSLPDAFLAAGASAAIAADVAIPDASARRIFDDLHRRLAAGASAEAAVAALRAAATGDTAWAAHLMVFR